MQNVKGMFAFTLKPKNSKLVSDKKVAEFLDKAEKTIAKQLNKLSKDELFLIEMGYPYVIDNNGRISVVNNFYREGVCQS